MPRLVPAMTEKHFDIAKRDDLTHRDADRPDRDPDVVAADGAYGGHRENSRISTGRDDVRDRRAGGISDMDRGSRRVVRIPRPVFPGAALRASGGSGPAELSLAAVDRAVFVAAAGRAAGAAPHHRSTARARRHGAAAGR